MLARADDGGATTSATSSTQMLCWRRLTVKAADYLDEAQALEESPPPSTHCAACQNHMVGNM
jgi:hypothetical protein